MAALLRAPLPLSLPSKPLRARSRTARCLQPCASLIIRNSAQTQLLTAPISKTLVAISKTLTLTQNLAETLITSVRLLSSRPEPCEEAAIEALRGNLSMAATGAAVAAPMCFAAISTGSVSTPLTVVASGMAKWLELYSGVLMVRVLLSWFPNIPWERQPLQAIRDMCDPYLNLFRNIVPPLFNALDVSPLLAFLVLGVLTSILNTTIQV